MTSWTDRVTFGRQVTTRSIITLLTLLMLISRSALPCDCIYKVGKIGLLEKAAVFSGRAMTVQYLDPDGPSVEPRIRVTFSVHRTWKGPRSSSVIVNTTYNKWTCEGYYFKKGEDYLVAASTVFPAKRGAVPEVAGVSICNGTQRIRDAEKSLRELGPGQSAASPSTVPSNPPLQRTGLAPRR
jgi:hypothetical protein